MADSRWTSSKARWAVPAVAVVAVVGAFVGPPMIASADSHGLPGTTPEQLVTEVASSPPQALSGTVVYTARLGLPSLPFGSAAADPVNLLSGTTTMRVWTDGQERSRVALQGPTSEYTVVADGPQAWTYSSAKNTVVQWTLDPASAQRFQAAHDAARSGNLSGVAPGVPTPSQLATQALTQVEQFSTVSVDGQSQVAGRDAYQLVVTPKGGGTLVSRVVVAVDAQTKTPLRVQVWSTKDASKPALESGFTSVSFSKPADSVLTFTPPAGATVQQHVVTLPDKPAQAPTTPRALPPGVTVHGTGWATVVERSGVDLGALAGGTASEVPSPHPTIGSKSGQGLLDQFMSDNGTPGTGTDPAALFAALTTTVPQGHLVSSALFSVLVTNDGRVLAGAVPAATLQGLA
jgi:outer membrane lipoprotein-sorting protein